jgi:hypothetical protein
VAKFRLGVFLGSRNFLVSGSGLLAQLTGATNNSGYDLGDYYWDEHNLFLGEPFLSEKVAISSRVEDGSSNYSKK